TRDLRESPYRFELDVRDVPDGGYALSVEVSDGAAAIGTTALTIALHQDLDAIAARLESTAKGAPDDLRGEMLFPVDRLRNVNRGRLEARTFDLERDLAAAQAVAAAVAAGKDPFAARTGDMKRHYLLYAAPEVLPYRMD